MNRNILYGLVVAIVAITSLAVVVSAQDGELYIPFLVGGEEGAEAASEIREGKESFDGFIPPDEPVKGGELAKPTEEETIIHRVSDLRTIFVNGETIPLPDGVEVEYIITHAQCDKDFCLGPYQILKNGEDRIVVEDNGIIHPYEADEKPADFERKVNDKFNFLKDRERSQLLNRGDK